MPSDKKKEPKEASKGQKPEENEEDSQKKGCMPKKKKEENVGVVPLSQLFRYASGSGLSNVFAEGIGYFFSSDVSLALPMEPSSRSCR